MQTEKSEPSGQRIMPETLLTSFPALSVYPRVGISRSASQIVDGFYLYHGYEVQIEKKSFGVTIWYHSAFSITRQARDSEQ